MSATGRPAGRSAASKSRGAGMPAHRRSSAARGAAALRAATSVRLSATMRSRMEDITGRSEVAAQPLPANGVQRYAPELLEDKVADGAWRRQVAHEAAAGHQRLQHGIP